MSTDILARIREPRLRAALPVVAAVAAATVSAALATALRLEIAAAGFLGAVVIGLVRMNPLGTVLALGATRATLEVFGDKAIARPLGIGLSPPDVISIAFLCGAGWWLLGQARSGNRFWQSATVGPALFLFAIAAASLSYSPSAAQGARDLLKWSSGVCAYLVLLAAPVQQRRLRLLLSVVIGGAVVPIAFGFWQLANSIGEANQFHGGLRIYSTFHHPNTYGFYLVTVLVAIWGMRSWVSGRKRRLLDAVGLAAFISMLLTLSRTAWGALALVVLVVGWRNRGILAAAAAAGAAFMVVVPRIAFRVLDLFQPRTGSGAGNSLLSRLTNWTNQLAAFGQQPLLGHGWGYTLASGQAAHNDYLRMMVETGVVGGAAIAALMWSLIRHSWEAARGRDDLPRAFFGLTLAYALQSLASNNLGKGVYQFYFWLLAGISYVWSETVPYRQARSRRPALAAAAGNPP
ncbi:MAG: O-antigen ligase family protein [Egibacteraceae bacterium]